MASSSQNARLMIGGTDATQFARSATVSSTTATADATTLASQATEYAPALRDAAVSAEAIATVGSLDALRSSLAASSRQVITLAPTGGTLGMPCDLVSADATTLGISAPSGDVVAASFEAQATGGSTPGDVLADTTASADGGGSSLDNGAPTTAGSVIHLHLTSIDAGSVTLRVQHSADGTTWADLGTTTLTSPGGVRVTTTGTVARYLRASWTLAGGASSTALFVAVGRG